MGFLMRKQPELKGEIFFINNVRPLDLGEKGGHSMFLMVFTESPLGLKYFNSAHAHKTRACKVNCS